MHLLLREGCAECFGERDLSIFLLLGRGGSRGVGAAMMEMGRIPTKLWENHPVLVAVLCYFWANFQKYTKPGMQKSPYFAERKSRSHYI
jgi:hypothetical protein